MTASRTDELIRALRALPEDERRCVLAHVAGDLSEEGPEQGVAPEAVIGLFSDAPELMADIVEDVMAARERDPLRFHGE